MASSRRYFRKVEDCNVVWKSVCQAYNVLLSKWQHGLISRDELEEELRTKIRPVFFTEPYYYSTDYSNQFMNGYVYNGPWALPDTMEDWWNKLAKDPQEFNDTARWTETDEYGQWEPGRWKDDVWIPAGYSGMIHVNDAFPTEAVCNGDNRADSWMYKEADRERQGYDAAWMMDFYYELPGTRSQWSDQRLSGEYGQDINFGNMYNEAIVVFTQTPGFGEKLWKTQYFSRENGDLVANSPYAYESTTGIVNSFEGVDPVLSLSYWEEYDIPGLGQTYSSRKSVPFKYHPLATTAQEMLDIILNNWPIRDTIIYPKDLWFRVERVSWDKMLFLCFSKVRFTKLTTEFGAVKEQWYRPLLQGNYWKIDTSFGPGLNLQILDINNVDGEPHWQLATAFMYRSTNGRILSDMHWTHVFNLYHTYSHSLGQPRWQSNYSDLLKKSLAHKVYSMIDYADVRARGVEMRTNGILAANNPDTELFTHGLDYINDSITLFGSAPQPINDSITLYMPVLDEKTGVLQLQIDGGGKQLTMPLHIHDQRMNIETPLYMLGGVGTPSANTKLFVYDDTALQNFVTDPSWEQWASDLWEEAKWNDQYTYTRFDATITHSTYPSSPPHFHKDFGTDYFGREFVIEFEYMFRDQGGSQAAFMPFIIGDHTRVPSIFNPGDQIMSVKVATDGKHTLERHNTATSKDIGYLVDGTKYYVRIDYGPQTPYGASSEFMAFQIRFWTNASRTGTPVFYAYHRMDDKSYTEKFDELAIGAAVSTGTYSFILENLWVEGSGSADSVQLRTLGHASTFDSLKLRTTGLSYPANNYTTMMVFGGTLSGSYWKVNTQPLFLYFDNTENFTIPLVVYNKQPPTSVYDGLPLFIGGVYKTETGELPLFIQNDGIYDTLPLFIYGAGTFPGYYSIRDDLRCYVHRPDQSNVMPLVMFNNTPGLNSFMRMRINGILGSPTHSCTLVIPNVKDSTPNSFLKLQLTGAVQVVSEATLALPETLANLNSSQPLLCYHSGGAPNSFVTAMIDGVYKETGYVMLAMPEVTHIPTLDTSLYIRGY